MGIHGSWVNKRHATVNRKENKGTRNETTTYLDLHGLNIQLVPPSKYGPHKLFALSET